MTGAGRALRGLLWVALAAGCDGPADAICDVMPDDSHAMPDDSHAMPDGFDAIPNGYHAMPDAMPNGHHAMPDGFAVMPDAMPDDSHAMPDAMPDAWLTAMTFNTGSAPELDHDAPPDDGYGHAEPTDAGYGNGLAWSRFIDDARRYIDAVGPDLVAFQEIFHPGAADPVEAEARRTAAIAALQSAEACRILRAHGFTARSERRMLRYETLIRPAETVAPDRAAALRRQILALNLGLSDAPAFRDNWRARIDRFFDDMAWIDLTWHGDRLVGHCGTRWLPVEGGEGYYVDNFTVDPGLQGRGIGRRLTRRSTVRFVARSALRTVYVVSRTQNPVIGAETAAAVGGATHCFPRFDGGPVTPELAAVAVCAARTLWPDTPYDPRTGVLAGAYGGQFLEQQPTRHRAVADYFARHLDARRGDALVQVLRLCPRSWIHPLRYFARHGVERLRRRRAQRTGDAPETP